MRLTFQILELGKPFRRRGKNEQKRFTKVWKLIENGSKVAGSGSRFGEEYYTRKSANLNINKILKLKLKEQT